MRTALTSAIISRLMTSVLNRSNTLYSLVFQRPANHAVQQEMNLALNNENTAKPGPHPAQSALPSPALPTHPNQHSQNCPVISHLPFGALPLSHPFPPSNAQLCSILPQLYPAQPNPTLPYPAIPRSTMSCPTPWLHLAPLPRLAMPQTHPAPPCPAPPHPALPCPALPCPALPRPALPRPALPSPAPPCPAPPRPALPRPTPPRPAPPSPCLCTRTRRPCRSRFGSTKETPSFRAAWTLSGYSV